MLGKLIKIGNSQGVMIPKKLIDELGLKDSLDITLKKDSIIIKAAKKHPREGWAESFREMHKKGDDKVMLDFNNDFDANEWQW